MPKTLSIQVAVCLALLAFGAVFAPPASPQRLDPALLLRWGVTPTVAPRPQANGAFAILASESLTLMRDGRLSYNVRDVNHPERERSAHARLTAAEVSEVAATLRSLCALRTPPRTGAADDVRMEVQFADLRGCEVVLPANRWRVGDAQRFGALVERLKVRALRGAPTAGDSLRTRGDAPPA